MKYCNYSREQIKQFFLKDFFKQFAQYFSGTLVSKGIALISYLYIAKTLVPSDFAVFVIFKMFCDFIVIFTLFGLHSSVLRLVRTRSFNELFNYILIICFNLMVFCLFIYFIRGYLLSALGKNYLFLSGLIFMVFFRIAGLSFDTAIGSYFVSIQQPLNYVKFSLLIPSVNLILLVFMHEFLDITTYKLPIYASGFTMMIFIFIIFIYLFKNIEKIRIDISKMKNIYKDGSPFFLKNLIGFGNMYLSRIILDRMASSFELAVYSFFLEIIYNLSYLEGAFYKVYMPTMRDIYHKQKDLFFKKMKQASFVAGSLSFIILLITIFIAQILKNHLNIIIRKEYLDNLIIFYILLATFLLGIQRTIVGVWQYIIIKTRWVIFHAMFSFVCGLIIYPVFYYFFKLKGLACGYFLIVLCVLIFEIIVTKLIKELKI